MSDLRIEAVATVINKAIHDAKLNGDWWDDDESFDLETDVTECLLGPVTLNEDAAIELAGLVGNALDKIGPKSTQKGVLRAAARAIKHYDTHRNSIMLRHSGEYNFQFTFR